MLTPFKRGIVGQDPEEGAELVLEDDLVVVPLGILELVLVGRTLEVEEGEEVPGKHWLEKCQYGGINTVNL